MPEISPEMLKSFEFEKMGVHAGEMVKKSIQAFISKERRLADQVCALDEEVDVMHRTVFKRVTLLMKSPDSAVDELMAALSISRYIERMADHATMIAREVIYLVTGEIVRHQEGFYDQLEE
ncbi:PhoU [Chlorobium ferrooxidans DSM 13031]|uniref:PhoU n=1 Tax=Chlorobium ferrooxidans DSM 13031 TaxID=377431 RepID=Q0YSU9_9CHLB|nr:PhoU [Chlorobium ferrooxidans DSM 13031]